MIELKNITKAFGDAVVLDRFSLTVEEGSRIAIMGESGSGKTTLLRIIASLERMDSGTLSGFSENDIAFVFQESRLFEWLDVLGNVTVVVAEKDPSVKERACEILNKVGLGEDLDKHPSELSGGMKQRVNLARALMADRPILLLDEPFSALDTDTKAEMMALVKEYSQNRTVIMVTHSEEDAFTVCDRIIRLTKLA